MYYCCVIQIFRRLSLLGTLTLLKRILKTGCIKFYQLHIPESTKIRVQRFRRYNTETDRHLQHNNSLNFREFSAARLKVSRQFPTRDPCGFVRRVAY